jgi:hypothetical protein
MSKANRKFSSARSGIVSLNQKELKYELKKLELAKRQYETNHYHEQRKMITRFATKLSRSSSNLETLFNNTSANSNNPTSINNMNATTASSTVTPTNLTSKITEPETPVLEQQQAAKRLTPILSQSSNDPSKKKEKKNVKWNENVVDKEAAASFESGYQVGSNSNFNTYSYRPSLYEMTKRYDEFKVK